MALLGEAMNRLNREYLAQGKTTTFEALNGFLVYDLLERARMDEATRGLSVPLVSTGLSR